VFEGKLRTDRGFAKFQKNLWRRKAGGKEITDQSLLGCGVEKSRRERPRGSVRRREIYCRRRPE